MEEKIKANLPEDTFYDFEFQQEYQDGKYFKLIPSDSAEDTETDEPQQAEETTTPEAVATPDDVPAEAAEEAAPVNDDF